jgi:hypothetical protein
MQSIGHRRAPPLQRTGLTNQAPLSKMHFAEWTLPQLLELQRHLAHLYMPVGSELPIAVGAIFLLDLCLINMEGSGCDGQADRGRRAGVIAGPKLAVGVVGTEFSVNWGD